jgi:hypothetical protein
MLVRIQKKLVDVADEKCATRSCFQLGQDKGTFVQGRGYTSYHKNPKWVCLRRMLHGCPTVAVCPQCRHGYAEGVADCPRCKVPLKPVGS